MRFVAPPVIALPCALQHDNMAVRVKGVTLVGSLALLRGSTVAQQYKPLYVELLRRAHDRSPEVRVCLTELLVPLILNDPAGLDRKELGGESARPWGSLQKHSGPVHSLVCLTELVVLIGPTRRDRIVALLSI